MTVILKHRRLLAETVMTHLRRRHFAAHYCETREQLLETIREIVPEGSSVAWGGSMTLRDAGITQMLNEGRYVAYDRDKETTPEGRDRVYRKAFEVDYYLASVNAMSEDGVLVNIDGNGNRVAAQTWGPRHVVLVVSLDKVCQDVDAAIKRARSVAAPTNMARFERTTPCTKTGTCMDCKSPDSICNYVLLQRMSNPPGRTIVVLTAESLGY